MQIAKTFQNISKMFTQGKTNKETPKSEQNKNTTLKNGIAQS